CATSLEYCTGSCLDYW
nr:immunoglobulin heavy chain junction region [Macaca mulatta]MOX14575.1 immunoglobulin heavy chain junction region [Macaca mulatta]MOX15118.1 immunoglobulin heavy chain junction region [Macaca mulatta]MOX15263.1 immunoglobulin heavy chain junction region [Macaca mulatta]MOX16080.1 immunoglobulin heavy chain junction region [Macaca mulatta]